MVSHIQDAINAFKEVGSLEGKLPKMPAKRDLFNVNAKSPILSDRKQKIVRQVSMKLLYVAKRTRMDIQPTIAFLCTRQGRATIED